MISMINKGMSLRSTIAVFTSIVAITLYDNWIWRQDGRLASAGHSCGRRRNGCAGMEENEIDQRCNERDEEKRKKKGQHAAGGIPVSIFHAPANGCGNRMFRHVLAVRPTKPHHAEPAAAAGVFRKETMAADKRE
jgi:hypothetical protein